MQFQDFVAQQYKLQKYYNLKWHKANKQTLIWKVVTKPIHTNRTQEVQVLKSEQVNIKRNQK